MRIIRRPFLLEPGEALLLCRNALSVVLRVRDFTEESGLEPDLLVSSRFIACPLPIYPKFLNPKDGVTRRRWEGTRPEFMWHPLMWLPARLHDRYTVFDASGGTRLESHDEWAMRLALELTASGLYDPVEGTWIDVLSMFGIDVDDELDRDRIADWLNGYEDDVLDAIDLSPYLQHEHPTWAVEAIIRIQDILYRASWALLSEDLLEFGEYAVDRSGSVGPEGHRHALHTVASLYKSLLSEVPETSVDGVDTTAGQGASHEAFFDHVYAMTLSDGALPDPMTLIDLSEKTNARLRAIREAYWPYLESLSDEDTESPAYDSTTTPTTP